MEQRLDDNQEALAGISNKLDGNPELPIAGAQHHKAGAKLFSECISSEECSSMTIKRVNCGERNTCVSITTPSRAS